MILLYQRLGAILMSMHQFISLFCLKVQASTPDLLVGKLSDLYSVDFETVYQYTKPVYLVHGTADELVPIAHSREMAQKYNKAKLVEVPGEPHDFKLNKELAEDISCFLHENCHS